MKKTKLTLRTETIAALTTDKMGRVRGGLCNNSIPYSDACTPECNETGSCVPLSAGYCHRG